MKRDTKKKKKLSVSATKVRDLKPVPPKKLDDVNGGMAPRPCGMSYRGWGGGL